MKYRSFREARALPVDDQPALRPDNKLFNRRKNITKLKQNDIKKSAAKKDSQIVIDGTNDSKK